MGFKNKKTIQPIAIDLNEDNVQSIFKRCLATDTTKNTQRNNTIS